MSDKPEKIRLCLCGMLAQNSAYKDTYYCSKCGVIHNCVTEYIRADLAKPPTGNHYHPHQPEKPHDLPNRMPNL